MLFYGRRLKKREIRCAIFSTKVFPKPMKPEKRKIKAAGRDSRYNAGDTYMFVTTKALVLREVKYKEADRILTVISEYGGIMTVKARGALRKNSKLASATQQLCFSEMTLFFTRGKWSVNEASTIETFSGLQEDFEAYALGCYVAECVEAVAVEDQPDPALMQLALNTLYALSRKMYGTDAIKAAFELRLMALAGYTPDVNSCAVCGKTEPERPYLSLSDGCIRCAACRGTAFDAPVGLSAESLAAMRYILSAPSKKLFSFSMSEEGQRELSDAAESYLLRQTERSFSSLDYWKKLRYAFPRFSIKPH